jgi:hypothetical protein
LFERVVRMSLDWVVGSRTFRRSRNSVTVVDGDSGRTRVGGSPKPAKLVISTFRFRGDMMRTVFGTTLRDE